MAVLVGILTLFFVAPQVCAAAPLAITPPAPIVLETKADIRAYIRQEALAHDIDPERAFYVAEHESELVPSATGDMSITCPRGPNAGKPVRSRGIFAITECYYPDVPDACAFDAKCNIDTALPLVKDLDTCHAQFTTCRTLHN